jgi:hypothetical protein
MIDNDRMTPSERMQRIREIQGQAAQQRAAERARPRDPRAVLELEMTRRLVMRLRLRELRNLTMSEAELAEWRRQNDEHEKDLNDYQRVGDASRDWTK